jgi:uncharacterized protein
METTHILLANLTSPAVLAFFLGVFACLVRSDLRVPQQVYDVISQYLLFAIGLKGGFAIGNTELADLVAPAAATLALGVITPILAFLVARGLGKQNIINAAALAAHYGSVSAVTFMAALSFVHIKHGASSEESFMPALLALLEIPAILIALVIASRAKKNRPMPFGHIITETFTGKTMILLIGGMVIGMISGAPGKALVEAVFFVPFQGVLVFFMLEMGIVAAERLREIQRRDALFLGLYGTVMPLVFACIGLALGSMAGLSPAGLVVFTTMAASASYIAAPAAVRMSLPEANATIYLTAALGVTLPFNLLIGIPLYQEMVIALAPYFG